MDKNKGLMIAAIGVGAYYLLVNATGSKPIYRDSMGNVITSISPGHTITFEVPGYTGIWLYQTRNGNTIYDAPYNVPMPPYILTDNDVGVYQVTAYELDSYGNKGKLIGSTTLTVSA